MAVEHGDTSSPDGFLRTLEHRLSSGAAMDIPEHDMVMSEMFLEAHRALPPLAFHAWAACAFASRRGLATDDELDAIGSDPYTVLFELERRGILGELARAVELPTQRDA